MSLRISHIHMTTVRDVLMKNKNTKRRSVYIYIYSIIFYESFGLFTFLEFFSFSSLQVIDCT